MDAKLFRERECVVYGRLFWERDANILLCGSGAVLGKGFLILFPFMLPPRYVYYCMRWRSTVLGKGFYGFFFVLVPLFALGIDVGKTVFSSVLAAVVLDGVLLLALLSALLLELLLERAL